MFLLIAKLLLVMLAVVALWLTFDRNRSTEWARILALKILITIGIIVGVTWTCALLVFADKLVDFAPPAVFLMVMAVVGHSIFRR